MAKVIGFLKTIKNNWKKSVFFTAVLSYGGKYAKEKYETHLFMTECCKKVAAYGDIPISADQKPKKVTVILNPAANKRNAKADFEKYCAPLLHLAGYSVTVLVTEREGGARSIVENLIGETDALIVAGGDGTLSEVVTGLLRRLKGDTSLTVHLPIGILPLGRTNNVAQKLLQPQDENFVHFLTNATLAIIQEVNTSHPVVKIENLESKNPEKCVYALNSIEWGALREAKVARDKYWYFGKLRDLAPFTFGKKLLNDLIDVELEYSPPCSGCSICYRKYINLPNKSSGILSWIASLFVFTRSSVGVDYSKVINTECNKYTKMSIKSLNVNINLDMEHSPALKISIGPEELSYVDFVKEGYLKLKGEPSQVQNSIVEAKEIILSPNSYEDKWLSIDNEDYEVKPMKLTLLPNSIYLFCPEKSGVLNLTKRDEGPKLSLDKFNKHIGLKQLA
ncbi:acylglycerol kinase, mitochondrial isoform X2 [Adelges cooleyi]|uniref:acylglycerol kinase, mitochondrial isoform X2 n=1 Tax=Adelges cooleyi TaxID=133065 RepID=UPI00217F2BA5|nr:acylglycerol kinase, mitochondrial isoform X2 [Adelges cooleyi]